MKSNNNNNNEDDDDDDDDNNNNNNNKSMGSVHARGDTFLTFGLKALTETNTSRLATEWHCCYFRIIMPTKGIIGLWASYSFTGPILHTVCLPTL
jgi:hypothetical protein